MRPGLAFIVLWFLAAFTLALTGWFERFSSATLFGFGAIVSSTGFAFLHWRSEKFRGFLSARSLRRLTMAQVLRFFGLLALILADRHVLPGLFAIPTGALDLLFAASAFGVARRYVDRDGTPESGFLAWHIAGLGALGLSAVLAVLTSSTRFGLVHDGITSQPMARFPMSLVPVFIGPFVLIFHLLAIGAALQIRRRAQ
jgi:hypothetical protein